VPAAQAVQLDAAVDEYDPVWQLVHDEDPVLLAYVPEAQFVHDVDPELDEY